MARKPTIRDIARLAGISKLIVSRVLNSGAKVNSITQDFVPDRVAMQLASGDHQLIHTHSPGHLIALSRQGLPVVIVNMTAIQLDILLVSVDHAGGARLATRHLFARGRSALPFSFPTLISPASMSAITVIPRRYGKLGGHLLSG